MVEFSIKHAPGRCCPDYDCLYGSWDKKHCQGVMLNVVVVNYMNSS